MKQLTSRLAQQSWWQVLAAVGRGSSTDQVTGLAAEMAFFGMLSVFPLTIAIAAGVGFLEPLIGPQGAQDVRNEIVAALSVGLPGQAQGITEAIEDLFADTRPGVFTVGLVVAIWSASRGFRSTVRSVDAVYHLDQRRTYLELRLLSLGMALAAVPLAAIGLVAFAMGPLLGSGAQAAEVVGGARDYQNVWEVLRWPVAVIAATIAVTTVLHIAPDQRTPWRNDLPGAVTAIIWWALATAGLRVYLRFGGSNNLLIGSLGAVLVVMIWLYLLALGLLIGAELNTVLADRAGVTRTSRTGLEFESFAHRVRRIAERARRETDRDR